MAQTYNLYLRDRLTEFDLIIQNLPYRDGLIVHNKLLLDAMVNYLCLQKFIVGEQDSELQAKIDELLETVCNEFQNTAVLSFDAETAAAKPISGSSEMVLEMDELPIHEESFNTFSDFMKLTTAALKYDLAKSIGSGESKFVLSTSTADTLKEAFEVFSNQALLHAAADPSSEIFAETKTEFKLNTNQFDIFYMLAVECEAFLNLLCSADCELWYTLGNADNKMVLTVHNGAIQSEKFFDADVFIKLIGEVNGTLTYFVELQNIGAVLSADVLAGLKRYRKVSEVDPLSIPSIDLLSEEELDYVVLA